MTGPVRCDIVGDMKRTGSGMGRILIVLLLLSAAAYRAGALGLDQFEFQYELRRISVDASDLEDSTEAVWTHAVGIRMPLDLGGSDFQFVPGLSFTTLYYFFDEGSDRAVPIDSDWRELTALVPLLDTSLRWNVIDKEKIDMAVETGFGLEFPVPVKSWESSDPAGRILPSLYSDLRFFKPLIAVQAEMPFQEKFSALFRLSTYLPLYHLWDGAGVSFMDGFTIGVSLGLRFR